MTRSSLSRLSRIVALGAAVSFAGAVSGTAGGWTSLFNGEDFTGWEVPENGPWKVVDGTIDCDPKRAPDVRGDVWSEEEFGDFVLYIDWRITDAPTEEERPIILPDGTYKSDEDGNVVTETIKGVDSGIFLRGQSKAQVNIWTWPVGSGEVWGYRTDNSMPPEVRSAVTPLTNADNPIGEWNSFVISMVDDRLSVILNGQLVIDDAQLPGVADSGPIALQFHGGYNADTGEYGDATSLVQFRNIYVKRLE
ncbi:MAG: DUF1080 domain-containing protein [Opitutales bacterium]